MYEVSYNGRSMYEQLHVFILSYSIGRTVATRDLLATAEFLVKCPASDYC